MMSRLPVTGILLAGGQSRRMGRDKASLPWQGSDVLHAELAILAQVCSELIVVSNIERDIRGEAVRVLSDNYRGCGPLAGLETGLSAANNDLCFVAACDMPFIDADSMRYIIDSAAGWDAAASLLDGRWQPLYAAYQKTCLASVRTMLLHGQLQLGKLFERLRVRAISADELKSFSPELLMLKNINTPQDWLQCRNR